MLKYENNIFNVLAYNVFRIALLFRDLLLDFPAVFSVSSLPFFALYALLTRLAAVVFEVKLSVQHWELSPSTF